MGALGARLGVPCSAAEQACSLRPQDYAYPAHPSAAVLQRLQRQLSKAGAPASGAGSLAGAFGPAAALQGEARAAAPAGAAPAPRAPPPLSFPDPASVGRAVRAAGAGGRALAPSEYQKPYTRLCPLYGPSPCSERSISTRAGNFAAIAPRSPPLLHPSRRRGARPRRRRSRPSPR